MAALRGSDGAFLLGEMAAHTASAGAIYFPAGTPDRQDVFGDVVDLEASVRRELLEETGLDAEEAEIAPGWIVVRARGRVACMKPMRLGGGGAGGARRDRGAAFGRGASGVLGDACGARGGGFHARDARVRARLHGLGVGGRAAGLSFTEARSEKNGGPVSWISGLRRSRSGASRAPS